MKDIYCNECGMIEHRFSCSKSSIKKAFKNPKLKGFQI